MATGHDGYNGLRDVTCLLYSAQVLGIREIKYLYSLYIIYIHTTPSMSQLIVSSIDMKGEMKRSPELSID